MKKIIVIVLISLVITLAAVGGVAYYFTTHGTDAIEQALKKEEPQVLAERDLFITPPQRTDKPGIELFSPLPGAIYTETVSKISGRLSSTKGIVVLDGKSSYLALTDDKGLFNFNMPIGEGVHTLTIFQFRDLDSKIVDIKSVPFVYFKSKRMDIGERLMMGEIMRADNNRMIKLSTANGLQSAYVSPEATMIKHFSVGGVGVPIGWKQLDHTDFAIIGGQENNGRFVATYMEINYYPYAFVGEIMKTTKDGFLVRRRGRTDINGTVILEPATKYVAWGDLDDFYSISRENLGEGDVILVVGYILPTVDRPNYHSYQIIRLPVGSIP